MPTEIINVEQGTPEWFKARSGIPTASEFSSVLAKGQGKTRRAYMLRIAGERITGEPGETFTSPAMERGRAMEDDARREYQFLFDADPAQVGFVRNQLAGCSPDGLIGDAGGIEIKTKRADLQIDVLLSDEVPSEHKAQLQGFLWVCEREWVDFISFWPGLPLFVKRVTRDEDYIKMLSDEVERFNQETDAIVAQIRRYGMKEAA
jgi:hypothetical protein